MSQKLKVTTLRKVSRGGGPCNDDWDCPGRHKVDGVPGSFVVSKRISLRQRWQLRHLVGRGEKLTWVPDELFDPYDQEV